MEEFPANSRQPQRRQRSEEEPERAKRVERIVTSEVVRRKVPLGRRMTQNLFGGDAQTAGGHIAAEILVPAARDVALEAITGFFERMIFGESTRDMRRSRRGGYGSGAPVRYDQVSRGTGRGPSPRRDMSPRARAMHHFDEIVIPHRGEAEEVLDRLDYLCDKYDAASVADLYELVGQSSNFQDHKWGWTNIDNARVVRVRSGYLLELPRPEPID